MSSLNHSGKRRLIYPVAFRGGGSISTLSLAYISPKIVELDVSWNDLTDSGLKILNP